MGGHHHSNGNKHMKQAPSSPERPKYFLGTESSNPVDYYCGREGGGSNSAGEEQEPAWFTKGLKGRRRRGRRRRQVLPLVPGPPPTPPLGGPSYDQEVDVGVNKMVDQPP